MSGLKVVYRQIADLIPYVRNARTHSEDQVAKIAASIKEFGWTNPILIDRDNGIIAGHGRLMAAKKLGLREVPTIELSGMTDVQKRAYILADNRLAIDAGWDVELLSLELQEIPEDYLKLTGFNDFELEQFLAVPEFDDDFYQTTAADAPEKDQFQVAFLFPVDKREAVTKYLKDVGKDSIVNYILEQLPDD